MRLLAVQSLNFVEYSDESQIPKYGVLSHRWQEEEVSYQDMITGQAQHKRGYTKLHQFCRQCIVDEIAFAWVDTCCINRDSSAELSEAINSMFRWYQNATKCYAYLFDFARGDEISEFDGSEWFRRGWTLQELIAPEGVLFYDCNWNAIGSKQEWSTHIGKITGIPPEVLHGKSPSSYSIAQRMSWAAKRKTTRVEDKAYSLMGLFDVNMPMLYGEGEKAFIRLQEEIMRHSTDYSIFAWPGIITAYDKAEMYDVTQRRLEGLLAISPAAFEFCGNIEQIDDNAPQQPFSVTNLGLSITVLIQPCSIELFEARLPCCVREDDLERPISIFLRQTDRDGQYTRDVFKGSLAQVSKSDINDQRRARVHVVQGYRGTSTQTCQSEIMFYNSPILQTPLNRMVVKPTGPEWYNSSSGIIVTWNRGSVTLLRARGGYRKAKDILLEFGFDIDFNPYVWLWFETDTSIKVRPTPYNHLEWHPLLMRKVFTVRDLADREDGWFCSGDRYSGLLIWFRTLNTVINVQKKSLIYARRWTIDIQKADLKSPHFLSWDDMSLQSLSNRDFLATNEESITGSDKCPICFGFLDMPISTSCLHVFCQRCFRWADISLDSTQLRFVGLDEEEETDKKPRDVQILCPVCGLLTKADHDWSLQRTMQTTYPNTYRTLSWRVLKERKDSFPVIEILRIIVGNTHKLQPTENNRHDWTFFVRPSNPDFVSEVKIFLHPTFRNNLIILSKPPFEIRRFGWGSFSIKVEIKLKPAYNFLHTQSEQGHGRGRTIPLDWTLDFYGNGSQGWVKMAIERTKPSLSATDTSLKSQVEQLVVLHTLAKLEFQTKDKDLS